LSLILAHPGEPAAPHDLWTAWNFDPVMLAGLLLAGWVYRRGTAGAGMTAAGRWRGRAFAGALLAVGVALVSPLEALSGALASAHMVQHVLLLMVAAPMFVLSAPFGALLRGVPPAVRRMTMRLRRWLRLSPRKLRPLQHPVAVWLLHVGTLWFWHASVPYEAALGNELVHVVEHASFLLTAALFWRVVLGTAAGSRLSYGGGIVLLFAAALHSVFLSALLTFAGTSWYPGYLETTRPWGLDPLADQQLAGVIMWVPAGMVYAGAALTLLVAWVRATEENEIPVTAPVPP
jgi:putative membrane protein